MSYVMENPASLIQNTHLSTNWWPSTDMVATSEILADWMGLPPEICGWKDVLTPQLHNAARYVV